MNSKLHHQSSKKSNPEALPLQGVSLGRDAWRRLRKTRSAMVALGFLILLAISSFFVPLLPLQSPQIQYPEDRAFLAPNLHPVTLLVIAGAQAKEIPLTEALARRTQRGSESRTTVSLGIQKKGNLSRKGNVSGKKLLPNEKAQESF